MSGFNQPFMQSDLERRLRLKGFEHHRFLLMKPKSVCPGTRGLSFLPDALLQDVPDGRYALQSAREGAAVLLAGKGKDRFAEPMLTRTSIVCFKDGSGDAGARWYLAFDDERDHTMIATAAVLGQYMARPRFQMTHRLIEGAMRRAERSGRIVPAPQKEGCSHEYCGSETTINTLVSFEKAPYVKALFEDDALARKFSRHLLRQGLSQWKLHLPLQGSLEREVRGEWEVEVRSCVLYTDRIEATKNPYGHVRLTRIAGEEEELRQAPWAPPPYRISLQTLLDSFRDCGVPPSQE